MGVFCDGGDVATVDACHQSMVAWFCHVGWEGRRRDGVDGSSFASFTASSFILSISCDQSIDDII